MTRISPAAGLRQRDPRIRDKPFLGFVARCKCLPCAVYGVTKRPVEVAHIKAPYPEAGWRAFGHSEKAHDSRTAPICAFHHREGPDAQHRNRHGDECAWWEWVGVYPPDFCAALYAAFEAGDNPDSVVDKFAATARAKLALRRGNRNP